MKLDTRFRPEKCVSTDPERPTLTSLLLDVEAEALVGSDGSMLVSIPVVIDKGDVHGSVPVEAFKLARKEAVAAGADALTAIAAGEECVLGSGASFPRVRQEAFPWMKVVPVDGTLNGRLVFNAALLKKMADALGVSGVVLEFSTTEQGPILVRPALLRDAKEFGVLMPLRIDEKKADA